LLRRQERGRWLSDAAEEWDQPDPDDLRDEVHSLSFFTGTVYDAVWHHTLELDPAKHVKMRRSQILQLSRYGRFGGGTISEWDEQPVSELRAWYEALKDLLDAEDALNKTLENR
jgi:hypothetical protein